MPLSPLIACLVCLFSMLHYGSCGGVAESFFMWLFSMAFGEKPEPPLWG